jgi:adenine/guanine/hypoxanthine permease
VFSASLIAPIFALLFTDMFDSISTFVGVTKVAGLVDEEGHPKNAGKALLVDGTSTALSGLLGSSPGTAYIESAAGVEQGGRSGLTAVVAGALFLPFMFLAPLLGLIPAVATAPVLVLVGLFMMSVLKRRRLGRLRGGRPAFVAMIAIPFTYSITEGIVFGFLAHV